MADMVPVFDGHNDFLLRLFRAPEAREALWLGGGRRGHIDLPRMRAGGMAGGLFAIFLPSPPYPGGPESLKRMPEPPFAIPLPPPLARDGVAEAVLAMVGHWHWMERSAAGGFAICRTAEELRAAIARGAVAGALHMEGAEAIGPDLDALHVLHGAGLRSLGPVWSRPNAFGQGVPFAFPGGPDSGPGLTEAGKALVRECNALKVLVDLSHLNAAGVEDVAAISEAPLVATHSGAHALCPSPRNLTDRQLDMIGERGGLVGLNFAVYFLRQDGRDDAGCGWEPVLRHLDYLIGRLGEDHVGFGSDFDGCVVPEVLGDAGGLQGLLGALRAHGYGEALIGKLAHGNWLGVLERTWGA